MHAWIADLQSCLAGFILHEQLDFHRKAASKLLEIMQAPEEHFAYTRRIGEVQMAATHLHADYTPSCRQ